MNDGAWTPPSSTTAPHRCSRAYPPRDRQSRHAKDRPAVAAVLAVEAAAIMQGQIRPRLISLAPVGAAIAEDDA